MILNNIKSLNLFFMYLLIYLALPGKSFSNINLMDAPKEVAYQFLARHIGN